ncbi:MAG: hypothetical protein HDS13_09875 [Bacteroides sp.]|nr:hypothetical protein [Bacteroides sp.]
MNKYFIGALTVCGTLSLGACSDDNKNDNPNPDSSLSAKETMLREVARDYVEHNVLPTYEAMADAAIELFELVETMQTKHEAGTLTQADIKAACDAWKASRKNWELSESFLFGPAGDYNIDPHIDSWPLDKAAMDRLLDQIRKGNDYSIDTNLGYGLLGFHSIEYMLFELSKDGNTSLTHSTDYTPEELVYLALVSEDLRNQCVCLEASWAGTDNVSAAKQAILEDAELDKEKNYGWMMANAGQAGSIFKTYQEVAEEILQGCIDIADEVGNTKIGRPHSASSAEDRNYIESPYSLNSIEDFVDNIISIRNSYCGAVSGDASVSDYVASVDADLDKRVRNTIEDVIATIQLIPEPLAKNATSAAAGAAVQAAGDDLVSVLEEAYQVVVR